MMIGTPNPLMSAPVATFELFDPELLSIPVWVMMEPWPCCAIILSLLRLWIWNPKKDTCFLPDDRVKAIYTCAEGAKFSHIPRTDLVKLILKAREAWSQSSEAGGEVSWAGMEGGRNQLPKGFPVRMAMEEWGVGLISFKWQHQGQVIDWHCTKTACHLCSSAKLSLFSGEFLKNSLAP